MGSQRAQLPSVRGWRVDDSDAATTCYLLEVEAPAASQEAALLDVVFVLDISSSMCGAPLAAVKASVALMLELLGEEDRVGLVAFCRSAYELVPCEPLRSARPRLLDALYGLKTLYGTNLEAGLRAGLDSLPAEADEGRAAALVVLSDGYVSTGESDVERLVAMARWHARRPAVSSLGYGLQHDEQTLHGLAHGLHGSYCYIEHALDTERHLSVALGCARAVVSRAVTLEVAAERLVRVESTMGARLKTPAPIHRVGADRMLAGQRELVVVEVDAGATLRFVLEAGGCVVDQGDLSAAPPGDEQLQEWRWLVLLDAAQREALEVARAGTRLETAPVLLEAQQRASAGRRPGREALEALYAQVERQRTLMQGEDEGAQRAELMRIGSRTRGISTVVRVGEGEARTRLRLHQAERAAAGVAALELEVLRGPYEGGRWRLDGEEVVLGRGAGSGLNFEQARGVSRQHLRFVWRQARWWVEELGSQNGTMLDDVMLEPGERYALYVGGVLQLGGVRGLLCRIVEARAAELRAG